jgi:hypothetical protein
MQRIESRPRIQSGRRRRPKTRAKIPDHTLESSSGSTPLDIDPSQVKSPKKVESEPVYGGYGGGNGGNGGNGSGSGSGSGSGGKINLSELQNALKRRKHKRPPSLSKSNESSVSSGPPTINLKKLEAPPGLSKQLSRIASSKGFKRLMETKQALPPRTPRVPKPSTLLSSGKKKQNKQNKAWETGDVRWIKINDKTEGSEGNNYVVAKFIQEKKSPLNKKLFEFELVDWVLENGSNVNADYEKDGAIFQVSLKNVGPRIEASTELNACFADMVNLPVVHEATVLHNLKQRYMSNQFMTNIGSILIIINPFEYMPELYGLNVVRQYTDGHGSGGDSVLPPHVYGIAQRAYRNLVRHRTNQAIIIAGESGAGKTETTKKCLQYLAEVCGNTNANSSNEESMEDRILSANPVFEAFGNAKTVRNNNSSRFGKWLEVMFHPQSLKLVGCQTVQYLLEKTRVVQVASGERNYSIFYQLLASTNDRMLASNYITNNDPSYYQYLIETGTDITSSSTNIRIADRDHFDMTLDAMSSLGFNQSKIKSIISIVSCILHLGNIIFEENSSSNAIVMEGSNVHLQAAANCLCVNVDELRLSLTHKRLIIVRERTDKPLTVDAAIDTRNALSKALYAQLFANIVEYINNICK